MANPKKVRLRLGVGILLLILLAAWAAAMIGTEFFTKAPAVSQKMTKLYYMTADSSSMKSEDRQISGETEGDIVSSVLAELKKGPKTEGFQPSIPENISFPTFSLENGTVTLKADKEYLQMSSKEEVICRSSVVWSLTELSFVDYVAITVDGEELTKADGAPIGPMNRDNVVIDTVVAPSAIKYETVTLYFSDENAMELVKEERSIQIAETQPKAQSILEQLIAGPTMPGHVAVIPPETKIREVTITEDGICYVNLSSEFVTKHSGGSTGELLTVYSIVNSLTELPDINKVQFLIEGEKVDEYKGHLDFGKPFEADPTLAP